MVKCCSKYNARQLKSRIVIQRKAQASDGMGGWTETWSAGDDVWALWKPMSGSERVQAMRVSPSLSVRAVIRFRGDAEGAPYYSAADRVTYRGRTYNITAVIDVDDAGEWLELMLSEGSPS
jgi:SPP1 family predicted phage head-tail adaptor